MPFALVDNYECWRCADARPVALLAAATALPERRTVSGWRALPDDPQAAEIEERVLHAGNCTLWFRRATDGSGEYLDVADSTCLPAAAFPECLLAVDAFNLAGDRFLISAFLARQAARLLMLPLFRRDPRGARAGRYRRRPRCSALLSSVSGASRSGAHHSPAGRGPPPRSRLTCRSRPAGRIRLKHQADHWRRAPYCCTLSPSSPSPYTEHSIER